MDAQQIFCKISEESNLLSIIGEQQDIAFIGDKVTIDCLKKIFKGHDNEANFNRRYFVFPELQAYFHNFSSYQALIITSVIDENALFDKVKQKLTNFGINVLAIKLFADVFVNFKCGQNILQKFEREITVPEISYAIVSTPRSGSTALCSALTSTNVAGFPKEHLRHDSEIITRNCNFDYIRYLKALMSYQVTDNNVFGTKFISHFLKDHLDSQFDFHQISHQFKWIYLIRKDKQKQAVSLFIAKNTDLWHATSDDRYNDYMGILNNITLEKPNYLEKIHNLYNYLLDQEKYIVSFFNELSISPFSVIYEEFANDNEKCTKDILSYLGINIPKTMSSVQLKANTRKLKSNLATEITKQYKERYS